MENKKKNNANLDKFKGLFLLTGLAFSLGIILFIFSWSTPVEAATDVGNSIYIDDEEMVIRTAQESPPPPPPPPPAIAEVINIVEDTEIVDEFPDWNAESDEGDEIDIVEFPDEVEVLEPVIFFIAEQMPKFPGGELALMNFISKNVNYPPYARENDIQGKVYIRFLVTKTGAVDRVSVIRGVDEIIDNEALKVVKELPDFKPGMQSNKPVNVWYTIPINFTLN